MKSPVRVASWAVYQMTINGGPGPNVVCHQGEWDAIEKAQPGLHTLIRGGITNEGEAERLARGTSGDDKRASRKKTALAPPGEGPGCVLEPGEGAGSGEAREDDRPLVLPFSALPLDVRELAAPNDRPDERLESA